MAGTQVQFRRGTTAEHATFTGAVGEVTVDTTKDVLVVHDGSTAGGFPMQPQNKAGTVLQVVQGTTSTQVTGNSTSYTDTSLTATITPSKTSSKILVIVNQQLGFDAATDGGGGGLRLMRGATEILTSTADATGPYDFFLGAAGATAVSFFHRAALSYLDSPGTTSAVVYKTQVRSYDNAATYTCQLDEATDGTSTIILMEIAG